MFDLRKYIRFSEEKKCYFQYNLAAPIRTDIIVFILARAMELGSKEMVLSLPCNVKRILANPLTSIPPDIIKKSTVF